MNGRVYDYNLSRFYSVDPVIQAPGNSQSLNPYSYIMNNPLAGTDPTGYIAECVEQCPAPTKRSEPKKRSGRSFVQDWYQYEKPNNGTTQNAKSTEPKADPGGIGSQGDIYSQSERSSLSSGDAISPKDALAMIQGVLGKLEKYNKLMNSEEAQAQLLLTAAVESDFMPRDQNVEGGGKGMFQIEAKADGSKTLGDLYANFLNDRKELKNIIDGIGGLNENSTHEERIQALRTNEEYGAALARIVYWRSDTVKSLSGPSNVTGMAYDWFNGYNKPNPTQRKTRDPSFPNKAIRRWNEYKLGELF